MDRRIVGTFLGAAVIAITIGCQEPPLEPPLPPQITNPNNNSVVRPLLRPEFQWDDQNMPDDVLYKLCFRRDNVQGCEKEVTVPHHLGKRWVLDPQTAFDDRFKGQKILWWVKACHKEQPLTCANSPNSRSVRVALPEAVATGPYYGESFEHRTPRFSWNAIAGAETYNTYAKKAGFRTRAEGALYGNCCDRVHPARRYRFRVWQHGALVGRGLQPD